MTNPRIICAVALLVGFLASPARSQSGAAPAFEVASVKPSPAGTGMSIGSPPGRFTARNVSLKSLITNAFKMRSFQLVGGPSWMDSDRFDIEAKMPDNATGKQSAEMLQTLLADRFQLRIHRETREMPIYTLVVGKNGPKLNPAKEGERSMVRASGGGRVEFQKVSLPILALNLAANVDGIVLDRTGVSGDFDFTLEWTADLVQAEPDQSLPSIFTAVQEQLGLKLESDKGPVEVLIIDHVERPTEN